MKRFRNLAVVLDGDEEDNPALDRALALARDSGAKVTVLDVVPELPGLIRSILEPIGGASQEPERRRRVDELESSVGSRVGEEVDVRIEVLSGPAALEITKEVIRSRHDLLLKAPRATREAHARPRALDTTALRLMRMCPCPVWVVPEKRKIQRILAAVDITSDRESSSELNRLRTS